MLAGEIHIQLTLSVALEVSVESYFCDLLWLMDSKQTNTMTRVMQK
jgi:hypothetical protein